MYLVDANILIYAFRSDSPYHSKAHAWVQRTLVATRPVFIPDLVQVAFLRINTLKGISFKSATLAKCLQFLEIVRTAPAYMSLPEEMPWTHQLGELENHRSINGNLINDAYLIALSKLLGATIVSADEDCRAFKGVVDWINPCK